MWLDNVIYEDQVIENERLEFSDKNSLFFLGHNLILRRCTLILRVPSKRLHINKTRIIDCTIDVKQELRNFRWDSVHLKGCRFKGRMSGNDFGMWQSSPGEGSIEDCDFSEARLDMTRFLGCDVSTLRFPPWPCFTILDPVRRWRELSVLPWPGLIGRVTMGGLAESPASTVALTFSAPDLAKRYETTPEALKTVVEKMDGVFY